MRSTLNKLGIQGNFLNLIKIIYKELQLTLTLVVKDCPAYPVTSGIREGCLLLLFSIALEALVRAVRQEKQIEGIQIGKK